MSFRKLNGVYFKTKFSIHAFIQFAENNWSLGLSEIDDRCSSCDTTRQTEMYSTAAGCAFQVENCSFNTVKLHDWKWIVVHFLYIVNYLLYKTEKYLKFVHSWDRVLYFYTLKCVEVFFRNSVPLWYWLWYFFRVIKYLSQYHNDTEL